MPAIELGRREGKGVNKIAIVIFAFSHEAADLENELNQISSFLTDMGAEWHGALTFIAKEALPQFLKRVVDGSKDLAARRPPLRTSIPQLQDCPGIPKPSKRA